MSDQREEINNLRDTLSMKDMVTSGNKLSGVVGVRGSQ
jgi:hypothetical protein